MPNNKNKYVAFVDILGFKEIVFKKTQQQASSVITNFSSLVYHAWQDLGYHNNKKINGFIVSDCVIIYTNSDTSEELDSMLKLLKAIFPKAIYQNGFMLRASITKGEFDDLPTNTFENLGKRLIVGRAYVDATILESKYKGSQIVFGQAVRDDIREIDNASYSIVDFSPQKSNIQNETESFFSLRWASIDDFLKNENLQSFVKLANESKWLVHYYDTIHLFLRDISNEAYKREILHKIWNCITDLDESNKRHQDTFIINAFSEHISHPFKQMMAKYLRECVHSSAAALGRSNENAN